MGCGTGKRGGWSDVHTENVVPVVVVHGALADFDGSAEFSNHSWIECGNVSHI